MKILGFVPTQQQLLIVLVPTVSIGIVVAGCSLYKKIVARDGIKVIGDEDLDLPLLLEKDYGDFRATCRAANAEACNYLSILPEPFFNFNTELANLVLTNLANQGKLRRALVIGSSTAGFTFELSRHFTEVKGIENSFPKVVTSYQFQNAKSISYFFPLEGSHHTTKVTLNHIDIFRRFQNRLKNVEALGNVQIVNADPDGRLSFKIGVFQVIILFVLNSLNAPESVLSSLHRFVEPNGLLFIVSDYNWKRSTNRKECFPQPDITATFDFLKCLLQKDFALDSQRHMPSVTPISLRSCTLHNYHVTTWRRLSTVAESDDISEPENS